MEYSGNASQKTVCFRSLSGHAAVDLPLVTRGSQETLLIKKAQSGDLAAFNELVLAYQNVVYRQAFWILREEEAAEDAVQEAFLKAYRNIQKFLLGRSFRSWLLKITTNLCLDMIRKAYRRPCLPLAPADPYGEEIECYWIKDTADTPEQAVERTEGEMRIVQAIQRLAPEYRTVIILADLQELDYAEVTAILKVPLGTMKSRLSRARQQLREALR